MAFPSESEQSAITEQKAQHYIPKFYLKGFTDKQGKLWVFEKFKPLRESRPKDEAHRPDYYTHAEKGRRDETAEDVLKGAESRAAPIILKLATSQFVLTPERAGHLIIFVAFMFARVPSWREHLDNLAAQLARENILKTARDRTKFNQTCDALERATGKPLDMDRGELRDYILGGQYDIKQGSKGFNLGSMFKTAFSALDELKFMGYQVFYAPKGNAFVTSDSPVYTLQPDGEGEAAIGMGFGHDNVEVYFPLNKRACLRLKKGIKPMQRVIEAGHVDQINSITMATASQYLYSSERYRRLGRLFDERGSKVLAGKNAFMASPPPQELTKRKR